MGRVSIPEARVLQGQPTNAINLQDHAAFVRRYVSRHLKVSDRDCDDIVQETLLAAYRFGHSFSGGPGDVRNWLAAIARNKASTHFEQRKRVERPLVSIDNEAAPMPALPAPRGPEETMMAAQAHQSLKEFLAGMPPVWREVYELIELEEMTAAGVADHLNIPENTVKTHLRNARAHVRDAAKRWQVAERRRTGVWMLPTSLGALLQRERACLNGVSHDVWERIWKGVQRKPEELGSPDDGEGPAVPEPDRPTRSRSLLPAPPSFPGPRMPDGWVPVRTLLRACGGTTILGHIGGGLIVWLLLHREPALNTSLTAVGSAAPIAGQVSPPPVLAAAAPSTTLPAGLPAALPLIPLSGMGSAASSAGRFGCPLPPGRGSPAEQALIKRARLAIGRGDLDGARALLERHGHEFPGGALRREREELLATLPDPHPATQ